MNQSERELHERALRRAEVRLWVVEREIELMTGREPRGAREDLEDEARELRESIDGERARLSETPESQSPPPPQRPASLRPAPA